MLIQMTREVSGAVQCLFCSEYGDNIGGWPWIDLRAEKDLLGELSKRLPLANGACASVGANGKHILVACEEEGTPNSIRRAFMAIFIATEMLGIKEVEILPSPSWGTSFIHDIHYVLAYHEGRVPEVIHIRTCDVDGFEAAVISMPEEYGHVH